MLSLFGFENSLSEKVSKITSAGAFQGQNQKKTLYFTVMRSYNMKLKTIFFHLKTKVETMNFSELLRLLLNINNLGILKEDLLDFQI